MLLRVQFSYSLQHHTDFFFVNDTATTEIYTLSLHDALPIRRMTAVSVRVPASWQTPPLVGRLDRKSTRLNSSHVEISYAVFCLKKKQIPYEPDKGEYQETFHYQSEKRYRHG